MSQCNDTSASAEPPVHFHVAMQGDDVLNVHPEHASCLMTLTVSKSTRFQGPKASARGTRGAPLAPSESLHVNAVFPATRGPPPCHPGWAPL